MINNSEVLYTNGLKNTKRRLSVLKILNTSNAPLSAEEIYQQLLENGDNINLSTIYRTLEKFLEKKIVLKSYIKDDGKACYMYNGNEHKHFLICNKCKSVTEIDFCPFTDYEKQFESKTAFTITSHKLELYGICPHCKNNKD